MGECLARVCGIERRQRLGVRSLAKLAQGAVSSPQRVDQVVCISLACLALSTKRALLVLLCTASAAVGRKLSM